MKSRTIVIVLGAAAVLAAGSRLLTRKSAPAVVAPPEAGGTATVHVYDDGSPVPDRWVVFHDPAGAILASVKTGDDGAASGPVVHGSMVTVAHGTSIEHLVTVTGVEPNDKLVVGEEEDEGGPETTECNARIALPPKPPKAARYVATLGVGATELDPAKPVVLPVLKRYLVDGKFAVLAQALDANGASVAFAHGWFGGSCSDGGTVDVHLAEWSTKYKTIPLELTGGGPPANVKSEVAILGAGKDRIYASPTFTIPEPLAGSRAEYKVTLSHGGRDRSVLEEGHKSLPERLVVDLASRLLPRVTDAVVEGHAPRPTVRWKVASASQADVVVVRLTWPATGEHVWTLLVAPNAEPRVAVPALPDALAAWRPDRRPITSAVALVESSSLDGFADVKKKGLDALEEGSEDEDSVLRWSSTGDLDF
jgi:hypothetical protein